MTVAVPALDSPRVFERGDRLYLVGGGVQTFNPTDDEIAGYAFGQKAKQSAPNEHLVWFKGQYVEADNPNGNGAMWRREELALKSLTPMLMPVTVMHDPRTAVGTIADVQMLTPEEHKVPRARIDTVLALWGHRFPEAVHEAEVNAGQGTLMQSMEAYSPWYECSVCGQVYHKQPQGVERALWCEHLRESNPSGGYVAASDKPAARVLGDVCFTGSGLIFGTRGAQGAYSEAYLEEFKDELASFHANVHTSTELRSVRMGLVQIDETELATLRKERDDARTEASKVAVLTVEKADLERKVETTEAAKVAAEQERDTVKAELTSEREKTAKAELKDKRWAALGEGFTAKLGEFTKGRLQEQAGTLEDAAWDDRLKELEEVTAVKRDAAKEDAAAKNDDKGDDGKDALRKVAEGDDKSGDTFDDTELAKLGGLAPASNGGSFGSQQTDIERSSVIGGLAAAFGKKS